MMAQTYPRFPPVESQFQPTVISLAERAKTGLNGFGSFPLSAPSVPWWARYSNSFFTTGSARSAHMRICVPE